MRKEKISVNVILFMAFILALGTIPLQKSAIMNNDELKLITMEQEVTAQEKVFSMLMKFNPNPNMRFIYETVFRQNIKGSNMKLDEIQEQTVIEASAHSVFPPA